MATNNEAGLIRASLFDDLVRCETRLYNAVGEQLRAEHSLTTTQYELLRYFRARPRSRVADVAAYFAAGMGAISKGVDRLQERGWVMRDTNPDDRRSSLVSLTADGDRVAVRAEGTYLRCLEQLLTPALGDEELAGTAAALGCLRTYLERERVGIPAG
ncbi:MarR family winged helix-turn-helix transcriptional regulator [Williamsia deligens]|uniref:MarR family winged helix-turn-helix transcriptional regulator n=1 Tax=Williamsia deligens TaxID=321325 RepID=A0ABW3G4V6_9NOCA|nr:MarR family winged helix-turn-helix transcriptional regulator [Williamsia deligens]MCP2193620.1 transcriptional regulator, MarR family [Williamsia deligens]